MGKQDGWTVRTVERAHAEISGEAPRVGAVPPYAFYGTDAAHLARAIVETCA